MSRHPAHPLAADPEDDRLRRSWRLLAGALVLLGAVAAWGLIVDGPRPFGLAIVVLTLAVAGAAVVHRRVVHRLALGRRAEAESVARILQGLSRSVSPDAIVEAIVEELGVATGADHVVVVRRRAESGTLEATLVSSRPGVPSSTTLFPRSDLDSTAEVAARPDVVVALPAAARVAGPIHRLRHWLDRLLAAPTGGRARGADAGAVVGGSAGRIAERLAARARDVYGLRNTLAAPLEGDDGVVGAIVLSRRLADPWPPVARRLLTGAAVEASAALARATNHRAAEARATTDALTGLPNRRYFEEFCALLARRRRADDAVGVLLVDIDHFKRVNDEHGHQVGDEVLRAVAKAIGGTVRDQDVPARFGGEEFAVLLRNPGPDVAVEVAERIRSAVGLLDLRELGPVGVTVSVGVAVSDADDQPIRDLIAAADRALYEAKRAGRDRVVAATEPVVAT